MSWSASWFNSRLLVRLRPDQPDRLLRPWYMGEIVKSNIKVQAGLFLLCLMNPQYQIIMIRKWLLNRKVSIFASSSFPEHSTLGDTSSSCPKHSTLGDAKSSIRVRFSFGFFFTLGYVLFTVYVTQSGKTGLITYLKVSRNAAFKYLVCCSLLMVEVMCTKFSHVLYQFLTFHSIHCASGQQLSLLPFQIVLKPSIKRAAKWVGGGGGGGGDWKAGKMVFKN